MNIGMFSSFATGHWFSPKAKQIWSDTTTLQSWLNVEAALAQAQAELDVIPISAAITIRNCAKVDLFDLSKIAEGIASAQHPLVPVLRSYEILCGEPAAGFIHLGATTQNIFETANSLQMHQTHRVISEALNAAISALGKLALEHKSTPMAGRTHGQHALPMTFGFKLAGWIAELDRDQKRLNDRLDSSFVAHLGGAIGTFAALGSIGRAVEARMATQLGLQPAGVSMRCSYDRVSDYISSLGLLAGTCEKIARDVVFMQRTEINEVSEAFHFGKVGSSTMAQKRNPSTALLLISLARMLRIRVFAVVETMVRMDEGDSSATNMTDVMIPEIGIIAASVAETLNKLSQGLVVHAEEMLHNLGITKGLIASEAAMMQLTKVMGRHEAHHLLYEAVHRTFNENVSFGSAIKEHPLLQSIELPAAVLNALNPALYVGESASITVETVERTTPQK